MAVRSKIDLDLVQVGDQEVFEEFALRQVVLAHGIISHGPVHGAGIDV